MSAFLTLLNVDQLEDTSHNGRGTWQLNAPLEYQSDLIGLIVVPAGFVTDFATVPRIPVVFDLVGDRGNLATTIHDYLYTTGNDAIHQRVRDRALADAVLREALRTQGVPHPLAYIMWAGVRVFGESYWNSR